MNYKTTLEQVAEDARRIRIPANRFFHRHFLVHEAGKVKEKRQKKESAVTRKRRGETTKYIIFVLSFLFCLRVLSHMHHTQTFYIYYNSEYKVSTQPLQHQQTTN